MYNAFSGYCRRPTCDTSHPSDVKVFRTALRETVRQPGFSPEAMGEYIHQNHADPTWPKTKVELDKVIAGLVKEAKAVLNRVND